MALILARSPYFISRSGFDSGTQLSVDIGTVDNLDVFTSLKIYSLSFRSETHLDISPFIRDYLIDNEVLVVKTTLSGTISGVSTADVVAEYVATDGYSYYEDGYNKDFASLLEDNNGYYAGSNNVVYRNRDEPVTIPFLFSDISTASVPTSTINYYKGNTLVTTSSLDFTDTASRVQYLTQDSIDSFEERVLRDEGFYEVDCSRLFHDAYTENTPDRVEIIPQGDTSKSFELTIVPVNECRYTPNKLVFKNKFGVEEDLWFFKKSVNNITTNRESYRANTLPSYITGDLSQHSHASYNVNGKKTMTINTGFIPESFNENLKQLMLSEKVWIYLDGNKLPITIKDSDMQFKTVLNEKLINYEMEIEFAYDIINTIG